MNLNIQKMTVHPPSPDIMSLTKESIGKYVRIGDLVIIIIIKKGRQCKAERE